MVFSNLQELDNLMLCKPTNTSNSSKPEGKKTNKILEATFMLNIKKKKTFMQNYIN